MVSTGPLVPLFFMYSYTNSVICLVHENYFYYKSSSKASLKINWTHAMIFSISLRGRCNLYQIQFHISLRYIALNHMKLFTRDVIYYKQCTSFSATSMKEWESAEKLYFLYLFLNICSISVQTSVFYHGQNKLDHPSSASGPLGKCQSIRLQRAVWQPIRRRERVSVWTFEFK